MKILQMIDVPWDSGLAHYALVLSQGLKKAGNQVFISAVPGQKPWLKARRLGLRTVPLTTFKGLAPLRRFLKDQRIDLMNAHTGRMHSLAVAAAWGQKVAVVRTRSDARAVRKTFGGKLLFQKTHRVIAAAEYIRQAYIKTLGLPAKKVVTIYQGIDPAQFAGSPLPEAPILGIVARLDPVKGHRYLLEALSLLSAAHPQVRLKIVGQEENIKTRDLQHIAERLHVSARVEFLGFQRDIASVMKGCRIGVIASTGSEAVSRVALEWMAAARPVVATRVGCLPELVDDPATGLLVEPQSAPALARALGHLLSRCDNAKEMGTAGRQRVEREFNLSDFVSVSQQVYQEARQLR